MSDDDKEHLASRLKRTPDRKHGYYPIDADLKNSLQGLTEVDDWPRLLLTGDYDLHDMLSDEGGQRHPVPSDSDEEMFIRNAINVAVAAADPRRPIDKPHLHVVQHGPQSNYVATAMSANPGKPLVAAVARPEFPLAVCDRGNWSILRTAAEHAAFYGGHQLKTKASWRKSGSIGFDRLDLNDPHLVALRRGSASGS